MQAKDHELAVGWSCDESDYIANEGSAGVKNARTTQKSIKSAVPQTLGFEGGEYEGNWAMGKPEGRGIFRSKMGGSFAGMFQRGWAQGPGIYHWADGRADLCDFCGPMDHLPLLAAKGEGLRLSSDRTHAVLLEDGLEVEPISKEEARSIAASMALELPERAPPLRFRNARVTKRELAMMTTADSRVRIEGLEKIHVDFLQREYIMQKDKNGVKDSPHEEEMASDFEHLWWLLTESPWAKNRNAIPPIRTVLC